MTDEAVLSVASVEQVRGDPRLLGASLDWPTTASTFPSLALPVHGWAVARNGEPIQIEIAEGDEVLETVQPKAPRPDIQALFPGVVGDFPGFRHFFNAAGASQRFALDVRVLLPDEQTIRIARIQGKRRRLDPGLSAVIQPLLLTTLARTGSTWLVSILSRLPEVVAYRPFIFEPRVLSYWMDVFRALSSPRSYWQGLDPIDVHGLWWVDADIDPDRWSIVDPEVLASMGGKGVDALLGFCCARVESVYRDVAAAQGQGAPRYFLEKCVPTAFLQRTVWEAYAGAREIILVRDFRDMVCSMVAYKARREGAYFGGEPAASAADYVRLLATDVNRMARAWRERGRRAHLVRYEDLVGEPVATIQGILEYLGLDGDPTLVQGLLDEASVVNPAMQRFHQTSGSVKASVGRWQKDMDVHLREVVEGEMGNALKTFGYSPTLG